MPSTARPSTTRLTVIDKLPADDPAAFPASPGIAPDVATLLGWIAAAGSAASGCRSLPPVAVSASAAAPRTVRGYLARAACRRAATRRVAEPEGVELAYETDRLDAARRRPHLSDCDLRRHTRCRRSAFPARRPHPTKLVQSAAMASVAPPKPSYRPLLPADIVTRRPAVRRPARNRDLCRRGACRLSRRRLDRRRDLRHRLGRAATMRRTPSASAAASCSATAPAPARAASRPASSSTTGCRAGARRSGSPSPTSCSRTPSATGRRSAWSGCWSRRCRASRRASRSRSSEGVLFTTYATLRSDDRGEKLSRVKQIVEWLGSDFDGVIIFDESHAMQNAAGGKGERGDVAASQQGRAGLRLQHALPNARVVYVSATGATTVHNLAYAQRLGLWGGEDFPFADPRRVRRGDRGRRRRGDGGAGPRPAVARPLHRPVALL